MSTTTGNYMTHSERHITQQFLGDAGNFVSGYEPKLVLHTTEGATYPGPHIYHGTNPHFTCDFKRRRSYQHCSIHRAARALANPPGGVETNKANCIQIELVGFASQSGKWTDDDYEYINWLIRHIRKGGGKFNMSTATPWNQPRFSNEKWRNFNGICGHMHVPENDHSDPGRFLKVTKVRNPK